MSCQIMKNMITLFILCVTTILNAQRSDMEYNTNLIDRDFIAPLDLKKILFSSNESDQKINLLLEKTNDSLLTIYLVNKSSDSLKISSQDEHLYMIQEAKSNDGKWKPIEYWKYSWCGLSYMKENWNRTE